MKVWPTIAVAVLASALTACNSSSSSSSTYRGGGSYASTKTESFSNDATLRESVLQSYGVSFAEDGDLSPTCVRDETYTTPDPDAWLVYDSSVDASEIEHLVVFAHGNGHTVGGAENPFSEPPGYQFGSWVGHMRTQARLAKAKGLKAAFVATDYRDNFGFPALWGAHDTIVATLHALERFPNVTRVYLMSVSMGSAVGGTAIVEAANLGLTKPADGSPLYDYWVSAEGVSQLAETWAEARAVGDGTGNQFAINAADGIQRDAGGMAVECPQAYQRRSPALNTAVLQGAGLKATTLVHAVNDGLVPYNQSRELATQLSAVGIPTQFFTVLTTYFYDPGTTASGYTGADGAQDEALNAAMENYNDPTGTGFVTPPTVGDFSGHASERYYFHPIMATAFANLELMMDGSYREDVPYFECVVDDTYDYYSFYAELAGLPLPSSCLLDEM